MILGVYSRAGDHPDNNAARITEIAENNNITYRLLTADAIRSGISEDISVIVFPGGTATNQARALGAGGLGKVRQFVKSGGGYIGICAGAWLALDRKNRLGLVKAKAIFGLRGAAWRGGQRLVALRVSGNKSARQVFKEFAARRPDEMKYVIAVYKNGPMFAPDHRGVKHLGYTTIATFVVDFYGRKPGRDEPVVECAGASICAKHGEGRVVLFSPHIESRRTPELHPFVVRAIQWASGI